jgi:hypothetical protein
MEIVDSHVRPWLLWAWETYALPQVMAVMALGARRGIGLVLALIAGMISVSALKWAVVSAWATAKAYGAIVLKVTLWVLYFAVSWWLASKYFYESLADAETQDKFLPFIGRWLNANKTASP